MNIEPIKYSLLKGTNGEHVLSVNGKPTRCPFTPPFPVQRMNGVSMEFMPCSTICPHATIKEDDGVNLYLISCGGSNMVTIELDDEDEDDDNGDNGDSGSEQPRKPFSVL